MSRDEIRAEYMRTPGDWELHAHVCHYGPHGGLPMGPFIEVFNNNVLWNWVLQIRADRIAGGILLREELALAGYVFPASPQT